MFGIVDIWLIWKLINGKIYVIDYINVLRIMFYNIKELKWDEKILEILNIFKLMLLEVKDLSGIFGYVNFGGKGGYRILIVGVVGD